MKNFKLNFGYNLSTLRFTRGVSQPKLAKAIGVSISKICDWEHGRCSNIQIRHLCALAEYFDCTTDYLLGATDDPKLQVNPPYDTEGYFRLEAPLDLKRRLEEKHMSANQLSKLSGVKPHKIYKWIKEGFGKISVIELEHIALTLNCTTDELFKPPNTD